MKEKKPKSTKFDIRNGQCILEISQNEEKKRGEKEREKNARNVKKDG